jgi:hypothetical protein
MLCDSFSIVWLAKPYFLFGMLHCAAPPKGLNRAFTFSLFGPALLANDRLASLKEMSRLVFETTAPLFCSLAKIISDLSCTYSEHR